MAMHRMLIILTLASAVAFPSASFSQDTANNSPPDWFLADLAAMTREGGRWIATNETRNDQTPYDQYGLEWQLSPDGTSMTGRLFGIMDGREVGDFWQFRQFWHPQENRAYVMQWGGGGMYGVGVLTPLGASSGMLEQTLYLPDGNTFGVGHMFRFDGPNARVTEQYDILPEIGSWRLNHTLVWHRAPPA